MFRVYKKYIKYKILSSLKDKLLFHCQQEALEIEKAKKRQTDEYKKNLCFTEEQFEKTKKESINWFFEQSRIHKHKRDSIEEIILMIKKL